MAKANEKKTRGKRSDTGGAKRRSKAETGRGQRRPSSGAKRGAKDRLAKAPTDRSRHAPGYPEEKRKGMAAHGRERTRDTGEITPAGE